MAIGDLADTRTKDLISASVFFANLVQQFVEFLAARVPDPETGAADADEEQSFNAVNPNTVLHHG